MRGKITKRSVDALKPATDGTETVLWDSELKGFGVRVQSGGPRATCCIIGSARAAARRFAS